MRERIVCSLLRTPGLRCCAVSKVLIQFFINITTVTLTVA